MLSLEIMCKMRDHNFAMKSIALSKETLSSFDAVVLTTDHDDIDYDLIEKNISLTNNIQNLTCIFLKSFEAIFLLSQTTLAPELDASDSYSKIGIIRTYFLSS